MNLMDDEGSVPLLKAISLDKNIQGFSLSSNRWKIKKEKSKKISGNQVGFGLL